MIFEDKFRSLVKLFWILPLVAAPSLILWGYFEAHRASILPYEGNTGRHQIGSVMASDKPDVPRPEDNPQAQRVEELEEKARNLDQKIKKRKLLLAKLRGEQGRVRSVNTKICESKKLAPLGSRPVVSLASLPGSGNTWVRYLLESASGIFTGSIYNDKRLYRAGYFGEYEDPWSGTILVTKSHKFKPEMAHNFDTAIVLVRNPYKAMISEYNRQLSGNNHTALGNQSDFSGKAWDDFVHEKGEKWVGIVEKWLKKDPNILIIYYEDIIKDTRTELEKMLKFLKIDIDPARMDCTIANQEGSFHRNSSRQFDPFTWKEKKYLNARMAYVAKLLSSYGKPALPKEYSAEVLT